MQVPAGLLGDKLGLRKVLITFYLLGAAALLFLGLSANSYILLIVLVGLHGIGMGPIIPPLMALILVPYLKRREFGFGNNQFGHVYRDGPGIGRRRTCLQPDGKLAHTLPAAGCPDPFSAPVVSPVFARA